MFAKLALATFAALASVQLATAVCGEGQIGRLYLLCLPGTALTFAVPVVQLSVLRRYAQYSLLSVVPVHGTGSL